MVCACVLWLFESMPRRRSVGFPLHVLLAPVVPVSSTEEEGLPREHGYGVAKQFPARGSMVNGAGRRVPSKCGTTAGSTHTHTHTQQTSGNKRGS